MGPTARARATLRTTAVVTLAVAVASLTLSVNHHGPEPPLPTPALAGTCAPLPYRGGGDVVVDLSVARPVHAVRVQVGQTLGIGGAAGCELHGFPPPATAAPLLEEIARHTAAGGDLDVEYRAAGTGTVTLPLCGGSCTPDWVAVTVVPAGNASGR